VQLGWGARKRLVLGGSGADGTCAEVGRKEKVVACKVARELQEMGQM
jgi:hypothetical protein